MSIANLSYDYNLNQYVAEVTIGNRRIASLMGACEPTEEERKRVVNRLRTMAHSPRRSNYVPANSADPEAYQQAWGM
jgi:CRISPR/Cas system CSM-associated protein Csm3 (group 7 of RAMP superfamily)